MCKYYVKNSKLMYKQKRKILKYRKEIPSDMKLTFQWENVV